MFYIITINKTTLCMYICVTNPKKNVLDHNDISSLIIYIHYLLVNCRNTKFEYRH